jgi:HK97 family phage portal protein
MPNPLSRLFGRAAAARPPLEAPATKASRTAPLLALHAGARANWSPRDYASFAKEAYQQNPVAHRAVRLIAEAVAAVPLTVMIDGIERPDHALARLIAAPNPRQARVALFEALTSHLVIAGNAYVEMVALDGDPRELHALRPDRVRIAPGAEGWPEAYLYAVAGREVRFDASGAVSPILHLAFPHPLDDHYGLSPIAAAAVAIDIHNEASRWHKALLDNSARPSGALVYGTDGANLTDQQFERLKAELEQGFMGAGNAGRPLLLEGGLDWKPLSLSPKDMDFVALKNAAAREIALALGLPPLLLGLEGDNTRANYAEANRAFHRQTVAPLVHKIAGALGQWLAEWSGAPVTLVPDFDAVEGMAEMRSALWEAVTRADFLSADEKRQLLGFGRRA